MRCFGWNNFGSLFQPVQPARFSFRIKLILDVMKWFHQWLLIYCACSECSANFEVWEIFAVEYSFIYFIQYSFSSKEIKIPLICNNEDMGLCCSIIITFCFIIISTIWWSWWNKKWVFLVDLSTVYEHGFVMNNDDRI